MERSKGITLEDERGRMGWSLLPKLALFSILMRLASLVDFCSFRRVCAAWRLVAKAGAAQFMASLPTLLFHPAEYRLYSVPEMRFYKREAAAVSGQEEDYDGDICGFSHGYVISRDRSLPAPRLSIVHPAVGTDFGAAFPAWPRGAARGALLTAPPTSADCVLLANDRHRLLYCRPGDREWAAHDWPRGWSLVSMVASNGKVYGLTQNRKLVVVEFFPAGLKVTQQEVEDFPFGGFVCLAGYGDELLAFPHRSDLGGDGVRGFRLYRLDSARGQWVEAEEMGGRALFVSHRMWAVLEDPSRWGWAGDCVYFAGSEEKPRSWTYVASLYWSGPMRRGFADLVPSFSVYRLQDKRVGHWLDARFPECTWLAASWALTNPC